MLKDPKGNDRPLLFDSRVIRGWGHCMPRSAGTNGRASWPSSGSEYNTELGLRPVCNPRREG